MKRTRIGPAWLCLSLTVLPLGVTAQGTAADYERAFSLRDRFSGLVVNAPEDPTWIGETSRFWYRTSVLGGNEFRLVDAVTLNKRPAFDHTRVAGAISEGRDTTYSATQLPFDVVEFLEGESLIEFTFADSVWQCALETYECGNVRPTPPRSRRSSGRPTEETNEPVVSPDGKREAIVQNYNVFVRAVGSEEAIALSMDGSEGNYYSSASIEWAEAPAC